MEVPDSYPDTWDKLLANQTFATEFRHVQTFVTETWEVQTFATTMIRRDFRDRNGDGATKISQPIFGMSRLSRPRYAISRLLRSKNSVATFATKVETARIPGSRCSALCFDLVRLYISTQFDFRPCATWMFGSTMTSGATLSVDT